MKIKLTQKQYDKLLNEMRFDGKSTGLFADEEPKEVNEFFGKIKDKWSNFIEAAKREGRETGEAAQILKRYVINKKSVSIEDIKFLKEQAKDLLKIVGVVGLGAISSIIPIVLEKLLNKKGMSIMPSSQNRQKEDPITGEDLNEGKKKKGGRPKAERSKSGRSIPGKYLTKNKSAMKKEIDTYAGKDTYKTKWDADYKSGKGGQGERYKTKESPATKAYRRMYGESNELDEAKKSNSSTDETLSKKAKASGISKTILKQVHSRGMAAWNSGHRPGTPQNAWAMGRVNSFITGSGGARKADSDLWAKAKKSKAKKNKSKKNESLNYNRMLITENRTIISEGLKYHLDNQIPLTETVYRYGSESFFKLINEVRDLHTKGKVDLSYNDLEMIKTDIGKQGIYEGKKVWLDMPNEYVDLNEAEYKGKKVELSKPKRGGSKKFYVYVMCNGKVKKVSFGAKSGGGNLAVKLRDPKARKAFADRHNCPQKNDKCSAGYWSCRLPRYAKQLGLSGGGTWW